jgi:hypothetical protein
MDRGGDGLMIKCPNCGSTAQVKVVNYEWDRMDETEITFYECGCGAKFDILIDGWGDDFLEYNGQKILIEEDE